MSNAEPYVCLFVPYYKAHSVDRQIELERCLQTNNALTFIQQIVVVPDDPAHDGDDFARFSKVHVVRPDRKQRQTFAQMCAVINKMIDTMSCPIVSVIANADIFFDCTLLDAAIALDTNKCFALSRYNVQSDGSLKPFLRNDSQDAWMFRDRIRESVVRNVHFAFGIPGCDNRFAKCLADAGYDLYNPSETVKLHHLQLTDSRTYDIKKQCVAPPYRLIAPCALHQVLIQRESDRERRLTCHGHHLFLRELLDRDGPLLVGRLGGGEIRVINARNTTVASLNVGVSPPTSQQMEIFSQRYVDAVRACDAMFIFDRAWFPQERQFLRQNNQHAVCLQAAITGNTFPLITDTSSWFYALRNKRVLIVSPFKKSIENQYFNCRDQLFPNTHYPTFRTLHVVAAPLTQRAPGEPAPKKKWSEHLERLQKEVDEQVFDVALLGCGGYAMPLAHYIREKGGKALVIGGVLQTYFGVLGERWHNLYKKHGLPIPTDAWIRPSAEERPACFAKIEPEDGSYW